MQKYGVPIDKNKYSHGDYLKIKGMKERLQDKMVAEDDQDFIKTYKMMQKNEQFKKIQSQYDRNLKISLRKIDDQIINNVAYRNIIDP